MNFYLAGATGGMMLIEGKKALNAGKYDEAIKCADSILKMYNELEPNDSEEKDSLQEHIVLALNFLGSSQHKKGLVDESFNTFNAAVEKAEGLYEKNNEKYGTLFIQTINDLVRCQFESKMFSGAVNNLQKGQDVRMVLFKNSVGEEKMKHCISYGYTVCDMAGCLNKVNRHNESINLIENGILFLWPIFLKNRNQEMFASLFNNLMQNYGTTLQTLLGADWVDHANEFFENNDIGISV